MNTPEITPSRIYLAAWIAAENALPPASRKLIDDYDEIHRAWGKAGWPKQMPPELATASKAIEEDPMASIAFDLRRKTNHASSDEWQAKEKKEAA